MLPIDEIILRLFLAVIFGGIIGLERERKDWAAGLRTHMMVSLGSCLLMIVSAYGFNEVLGKPGVSLDPSRVAAQVVSGIGFIGAGAILFLKGGIIRGLTTAAGLWTVSAIGLAVGGGMFVPALFTTALALIILWALEPFERRFQGRFVQKSIRLVVAKREKALDAIRYFQSAPNIEVIGYSQEEMTDGVLLTIRLRNAEKEDLSELLKVFDGDKDVRKISWNA